MASHLLSRGHRTLLVGWRYLPLWARRLAIRVLYPRFPVGAVAIISDARGRILLVRQVYHRREAWGAPGGWLTSGESPRQAAAREAFEEIGVRLTVGRILAVGSGPYREISLAFECRVAEDWAPRLSEEIDRVAYFSPEDLPPLPVATRRLIEEALAAQESLLRVSVE
jgi:8-oxo-dGTP diphosphatase